VPVDLTLEGSPDVSQSALIALYGYLAERGLLETRPVLARSDYATLEALLLAERVLIVPPAADRAAGLPRAELRGRAVEMASWPASERRLAELGRLLCELNPALCSGGASLALDRPIPAGTRLTLPSVALESRLRRRDVELDGRTPEWHLERMVFSPEQKAKAGPELLRRLNPQLEAATQSGRMVLPVESWFATVAVAAADLESPESAIRGLAASHRGVGLYARAAYTQQLAKSLQDPPEPVDGDLCSELRAERRRWLEAIRFPFSHDPTLGEQLLFPRVETARVSIGVLESQSQLRMRHQIFDLDPENPAWYEPLDFELVAPSVPVSAEGAGEQVVEDRATYSRDLHHGTHVAALLGGRSGPCWSGLLPRSKLVMVDVATPGGLRDRVLSAMAAGTRAFNVSQELTRSQSSDFERDSIKRLITAEAASAVFVVAAGNDGKDLNTSASVQLPAGLGQAANVVTVTAVTAAQSVLGPFVGAANQPSPGANRGKLFVDLAAPGEGIVSASADRRYGPATGTSQAAPAVAAAAAFLADEIEGARQAPGEVKARLIATADWNPGLEGQVWGGLFNFGDAVRYPDRNLLQTANGGESRLYSITARGNPRLKVTNQPRYYERDRVAGLGRIVDHDELRLQWVLSIKSRGDGTHRVVFRDPLDRRLYILLDAALEGAIECTTFELLDERTLAFLPRPQDCAPSISIAQVNEYVAALPYHVEW
jgi:subtilisin family serine protease